MSGACDYCGEPSGDVCCPNCDRGWRELTEERDRLKVLLIECRKVLSTLEWFAYDDGNSENYCLWCEASKGKSKTHHADCKVAALIAKLKEVE